MFCSSRIVSTCNMHKGCIVFHVTLNFIVININNLNSQICINSIRYNWATPNGWKKLSERSWSKERNINPEIRNWITVMKIVHYKSNNNKKYMIETDFTRICLTYQLSSCVCLMSITVTGSIFKIVVLYSRVSTDH